MAVMVERSKLQSQQTEETKEPINPRMLPCRKVRAE